MRLTRTLIAGSLAAVFWFPTAAFSQSVAWPRVSVSWPVVFACPVSPTNSVCTAVDQAGKIFVADRYLDPTSFAYVRTISQGGKVFSGSTDVSCGSSTHCGIVARERRGNADVWYVYTPTTP
jgi:hypothetical protein